MKKLLLLPLLLQTLPLFAAERTIELDPARTKIAFTLVTSVHTVHGTFKLKRGTMKLDSATGAASGEVVVDVPSGDSDNGMRDRRMQKEILESPRYPDAVFIPDHVTGELAPTGASQLDVHGTFQLHGSSHEMTLHFMAENKGSEVVTSTTFMIPYVAWGIKNPGNFLIKVNDNVEMTIQATAKLQ